MRRMLIALWSIIFTMLPVDSPAQIAGGGGQLYQSRELPRDLDRYLSPDLLQGTSEELRKRLLPPSKWSPQQDDSGVGQTTLSEALRRKQLQLQIPSDPGMMATALTLSVPKFAEKCAQGQNNYCRLRDRAEIISSSLLASAKAAPDCSDAARNYQAAYGKPNMPEAIARAYDVTCLGSFETRVATNTVIAPASPPAITGRGALSVIALLEYEGTPFCGGLLRGDRTVITARHCFDDRRKRFNDNQITVRSADGAIGPLPIKRTPASQPTVTVDDVNTDWVILAIDTTAPISVPATSLTRLINPGPATVIGHYSYYDKVKYAPGASTSQWRRGLRFPRPQMCQSILATANCLQIICQTVQGFSGTPVFSDAPAGDGALQVIGFISRQEQLDSGCGGADFFGSTYAVSADAIR